MGPITSQLTTLLLCLSAATTTAAVDVELFENPESCDLTGGICRDVVGETCCHVTNRLWGSAGVGFVTSGSLQLYSSQAGVTCALPISTEYNTPICIGSGFDLVVSGAVYRARRVERAMADREVFANQQAELMAVKDGKQYIISLEKQATIEDAGARRGADLNAYVVENADIVRDYNADRAQVKVEKAVE